MATRRRCGVFALFAGIFFSISCCAGADLLQDEDGIIRHVILEPEHVIRRRSVDKPLRISTVFVDIKAIENPEPVEKALKQATEYFRKTFKVRATVPEILLQRPCTNGSYFLKDGVRYCKDSCASKLECGSAENLPLAAFDACRTCDESENNCINGTGSDLGPGTGYNDTDFVLFVTAIENSKCEQIGNETSTLAFATFCQQESGLDRPVVGSVNICPAKVTKETLDSAYSQLLATLKHEIFHALGFSPSLYAFYRNASGFPLTPRGPKGLPLDRDQGRYKWSEETIRTVTRTDWAVHSGNVNHDVQVMVTPQVREEARRHFNCDTLEGAELENSGGDQTKLAHWEKRLFENEGMTGTISRNAVFSRLTLALMEDTGWYQVDYSMAEPLEWGKNLGCLFAKNSCKAWMSANAGSIQPFCDNMRESPSSLKTGCTEDKTSVALCTLKNYTSALPKEYQYFDSPKKGGEMLADFCPYFETFTWTDGGKAIRDSTCMFTANSVQSDRNYALESYGQDSRCFEQGMKWQRLNCKEKSETIAANWGSGCYQHKCENDGLKIIVGGKKFRCYYQGQVVKVMVKDQQQELYEGSLICPWCQDICTTCPAEVKPAPKDSQPQPDECSSAQVVVMETLLLYFFVPLAIYFS